MENIEKEKKKKKQKLKNTKYIMPNNDTLNMGAHWIIQHIKDSYSAGFIRLNKQPFSLWTHGSSGINPLGMTKIKHY